VVANLISGFACAAAMWVVVAAVAIAQGGHLSPRPLPTRPAYEKDYQQVGVLLLAYGLIKSRSGDQFRRFESGWTTRQSPCTRGIHAGSD
jgi:hypothetical protein